MSRPGGARSLGAALLVLASLACGAESRPNPNPPDQLLVDSLGLGESDHVHRVRLASSSRGELVDPSLLEVEVGSYVEFFTEDRRVRTVRFLLDSVGGEQSRFLRSTAQESSPPLVELDSRFVVSFQNAPPGRYPFVVEGNGEPVSGVVVVRTEPAG